MWSRAFAADGGRRHIVEMALGEDGRPHGARDERGEDEADDDDDGRGRGAERDEDEQGDDDQRQRQEHLDQAADDRVDPAAEIAHHEADRRPERGAEQRGERRDGEDVARADEDAGEHVAADLVGAEPVLGRRRRKRVEEVVGERIVGHEGRREGGAERPEEDDRRADQEGRAAQEDPDRRALLARRGCGRSGGLGRRARLGGRAHRPSSALRRGLSMTVTKSAMRVAPMKKAPIVRMPACSMAKSLALAAARTRLPMPW